VASTGQVPPSTSPSPTTTSAGNASIGGSGTDASTTSTSLAPTTTAGTLTACDEPACSGAQLVAYPSLLGVPQLGVDPVQGSGCGLADEFGESVPDGLWFGLVYPDGNSMNFDVICVYYGDSARAKRAPAEQEAFFPVNVGTRERAVPLAPDFVWRQGVTTPDGSCTDTGPAGDADWSSASGGTAAWINVSGGVVTGAVAMCPV
jgi:hypothetical protein